MKTLLSIASLVALSAFSITDEPFSLAVGETVTVDGTDLSLTFAAVPRDSRCPRDVTCIVAGEAVVVLEARLGGQETELTFKVPPEGPEGPGGEDEQELDGFTIIVVELEPETNSTKKIDPSDYVATVVVSTR